MISLQYNLYKSFYTFLEKCENSSNYYYTVNTNFRLVVMKLTTNLTNFEKKQDFLNHPI
jgi:hypothetical protein